MNPIDTLNATAARAITPIAAPQAPAPAFAEALRDKTSTPPAAPFDKSAGATPPEDPRLAEAREAAADFISTALVKPILAQLRATSTAAEPFKPGLWEKQFGPMVDAAWADNLVRASNWDIVDAVARQLISKADAPTPAPAGADGAQQRSATP